MKCLTVGSLFSGIGGIDLGLERAGMEVRWHSEIDPYASRVLKKHWPHVPNLGDITKIDFAAAEPVDVLAGGFPCQDISGAGTREGIEGSRSGLWREYARAIDALRPRYVLVENVRDLLVRGFGTVLGDLAALGYDAEWDCIPAAAVGAPHRRDRVFLLAYPGGAAGGQPPRSAFPRAGRGALGVRAPESGRCRSHVADAGRERLEGDLHAGDSAAASGRIVPRCAPAGAGCAGGGQQWAAEPDVGRVADGVPSRVDRLRGLGNAVVPQIPELIGGWIIEHARATGYLESAA